MIGSLLDRVGMKGIVIIPISSVVRLGKRAIRYYQKRLRQKQRRKELALMNRGGR